MTSVPVPQRRLSRALLSFVCATSAFVAASAGPQDQAGFLWVAESNGLLNIATDDGEVRFEKSHALGYSAVAVNDINGDVWALRYPDLIGYDRWGAQIASATVPLDLNPVVPADLVVDGIAGNLWIAVGTTLYRYNLAGVHQQAIALLPNPIVGLTLDRTNSALWVGQLGELRSYDDSGNLLQSIPLADATLPTSKLHDLAHDRSLGELWVARGDRLERYDAAGAVTFSQSGDFKGAISPDGANGIWIASLTSLRHVSHTGTTDVEEEPFGDQPLKLVADLVGDPTDASVWVASLDRIRHYAVDGQLLNDIAPGAGSIQKLARSALYSDLDAPEIQFTAPADGSAHASATPSFQLAYFDLGVGIDQGTLRLKVDGVAAGFTCTSTTAAATCTPDSALADGQRTITAAIADAVGNISEYASRTITVDTVDPLITITQPAPGSFTHQTTLTIQGSVSEPASLTINGVSVAVDAANTFSHDASLSEGANSFALVATDLLGNQGTASLQVTLDTGIPALPDTALITVGLVVDGTVTVTGAAGSVEAGAQVRIHNTRAGQVVTVTAAADGSFTASIASQPGDVLEITQLDSANNASPALSRGITVPNPIDTAPPLNPNEFTPMLESVSFLYSGPNAVQLGVTGTFNPELVAVLRGRVLDSTGAGLIAVRISAKDHPEWGYTFTRADGAFDFVANGGGSVFLDYAASEFVPIQRQIEVPWRQYKSVDDVVMTRLDSAVTQVALGTGSAVQLAESSTTADAAGTRAVAILFPSNTTATMTFADGSTAPLTELSIRATEYTVGENGPKAMPGVLPATSAYTYAVELSVDQALQAGATEVTFSKNLPVYVDNFLGFPVGEDVPAGYYDRAKGQWVPSNDGRIIKVLSEDPVEGAVLDISGSGTAATPAQLSSLGITSEERLVLASRFDAGAIFWRVPVKHFTPWDFNWPFSLPDGATAPPASEPAQPTVPESKDTCEKTGCVIDSKAQSLGEDLSLTGVTSRLHYRSDRSPRGRPQSRATIKLTESSVPSSVRSIELDIEIAGRRIHQSFARAPNLSYTFSWDGKDAYGRDLAGSHEAKFTVAYVYSAVFRASRAGFAQSFAAASGAGVVIGANRAWRNITVTRKWTQMMSGARPVGVSAGGWSLTQHHQYDPGARTLFRGDGSRVSSAPLGATIHRIAGGGNTAGYNVLAKQSNKLFYQSAVSPAGEVHLATGLDIAKIDSQGYLRLVKSGLPDYASDLDFGPDGRLYVATRYRVHRLEANGTLTLIAGSGSTTAGQGDGGPAVNAGFGRINSIDVAADGSIYVVDRDYNGGMALRISPSGVINSIICCQVGRVAAAPDGSVFWIYTWTSGVKKYRADGVNVDYIAGYGQSATQGDGGPVSSAALAFSTDMALTRDGVLIVTDGPPYYRAVTPDDIINSIAGGGTLDIAQADGGSALNASLPGEFSIADDGRIIAILGSSETPSRGVAEIRTRPLDFAQAFFLIPSEDGSELYEFSPSGRHLRTKDAFTGQVLYQFTYNAAGQLIQVSDVDGDATLIERDAAGMPTAIVGPDGHRTTLTVDAEGNLATLTDPAGNSYEMTYYPGGLLHTFEDPRHNTSTYTYDPATGRLVDDDDPAGGGWTLSSTVNGATTTNTMTSNGGRTTQFLVQQLATGAVKHTTVAPDGTSSIRTVGTNFTTTDTAANLTVVTTREGRDPRFGINAPPITTTVTVPSGKLLNSTTTRSLSLSDSSNPLSLTSWSETTALNSKNYLRSYAPGTKTWTMSSPLNRQTIVTLNAKGRPATSKFANFEATGYTYTAEGRLDLMTTGAGGSARITDFNYYGSGPYAGFLQSVTDAENRTVSYEYDLAGRVTKQTLPDSRFIQYGYDANGNLESITPPGRDAHVFHYTAVNLEDDYTPPTAADVGTRLTHYSYNLDKDLDLITRPDGQTVDFVYEGPGKKLSSIVIPTGTYGYGYDPTKGYLTSLTAPGGQNLAFAYDGMLLTTETASGVVAGTVSWGYNNDFRVNSQSINGSALSFGYDNDGLLTTAGAETLVRYTSPNNGLLQSTTVGNVTTSHTYNTFGEPATDTAAYNGTTIYSAGYTVRDKLGRIKEKTETVQGVTSNYVYGYDVAGRLDTVTKDGVLISDYDYDSNGNRTALNGPTAIATYDGQDRLLSYGSNSYTYTENGELLTKVNGSGTTTYGYDVLGNLRTVSMPNGDSIEYVIDGRNRPVGKKVNGVLVQGFLYGNQLEPIAELDGSGNLVSRFVYGSKAHVPDYMVRAGVTYRIISDHLGNPRLVINTVDGSVAQRMDFDEFGKVTNDTSPEFQPFGFAGGIYDQHTKLTRFGARDYHAETGRWTVKDPIGFSSGDSNTFAYVGNDPINYVDRSGYCANNIWGMATEFALGFIPGYDLYQTINDPNATWLDYASAAAGLVPGPGKMLGIAAKAAQKLKRFEKKLPANASDIITRDLPGGGKAYQADSAARDIPGSYATYEKQVDGAGNTVQYTKTTYAPDGSIVHVKDKLTGETYYPGQ